MTKQSKHVPALRFREFEDEWDSLRLANVVNSIRSGRTIPEGNGRYPVYGSTGEIGRTDDCSHDGKYILIARVGANAGLLNLVAGKFGVTDNTLVLDVADQFNLDFLFQGLSRIKLNRLVFGSGQPLVTGGQLSSIQISLPSGDEQQKIAAFLSAVDERIAQLEKKKELLVKYKKGVMQQIFSQKIRFKDDNGNDFPDWKEKRAKEIFVSHSNKAHDGTLPILAATQENGMVSRDGIGIRIQSTDESVKGYKIVEPGDFVISLRSFQGGLEYSEYLGICSPAYTILKPKIPIDDNFFKFYFKKEDFITRLSLTVVGIRDGKQITYEAFGGLTLTVPSVPEQEKIASFLLSLEERINGTNHLIETTKRFKKGLLQQMFI